MPYICSKAIIGPRLIPVAIPANMIDVPCENQVIDMSVSYTHLTLPTNREV